MLSLLLLLLPADPAFHDDSYEELARPFIRAYCAACHGNEQAEGGLTLTGYASAAALRADPEVWDYVRERVELVEMPPRGAALPSGDERAAFLTWLTRELSDAPPGEAPDPGRPVMRRLNNAQYQNAVRDLFGVDFPARQRFPSDGIGHGFDTVGEALTLPELRLEKLLEAAEAIAGQVFVVDDSDDPPVRRLDPEDLNGRGNPRGDAYVMPFGGDVTGSVVLPRAGRYRMRMRLAASQAGDEPARVAFVVDGRALHEVEVPESPGQGKVHEHELRLEVPGPRNVAARFLNDYYDPDFPDPQKRDRNLVVEWIEVVGPIDAPPASAFQAELLARYPADLGRERERAILGELTRRVWRRPATDVELERLERLPPAEDPLVARLHLQLTALLASPHFLFFVESDGSSAGQVRPLNDHELATRLAAFLWSSVPDRRLDALADAGELGDPVVLEALVRDMLADPRSNALGEDFALQWLGLRALDEVAPDPELFPGWSAALAGAMSQETQRVFLLAVRENRSVWELLDGDWTVVDGLLAEHYGLDVALAPGEFERVSLADTPRRGVLGHAGVLTVTSDPTRTSPVKRGKWVLEVLLAAPPPSPPPGADSLDESAEAISALSLRERLGNHRERLECAVCHDRMDPIGFGLEPFDAVGRLREFDGKFPIDASGVLPDGRSFDGPEGLVGVLRQDPRFPRAVTEKLFVYALGRGLERGDRRHVQAILEPFGSQGPGLADLIVAIVRSDAFRTTRAGD